MFGKNIALLTERQRFVGARAINMLLLRSKAPSTKYKDPRPKVVDNVSGRLIESPY